MPIEMTMVVVAVHGEGDRDTVNRLQDHRNEMELQRHKQYNIAIPAALSTASDEDPDILIVLRDPAHDFRMEWPIRNWDEVESWKALIGYDEQLRHWKHGATVKVSIG